MIPASKAQSAMVRDIIARDAHKGADGLAAMVAEIAALPPMPVTVDDAIACHEQLDSLINRKESKS